MSECIIAGGGRTSYIAGPSGPAIATDLPVLNSEFPMDNSVKYNGSEYILNVIIDMYPTDCTYQWYKDNQPIIGANQSIYAFTPEDVYATYQFHCVVSNSLGSVISRKASIIVYPTKFYIVKNNLCDETKLGAYKLYSGSGSVSNESMFQIWTNSTNFAIYKQTSKAPTSRYNNVSFKYQLDGTDMNGNAILTVGNAVMYEFGYSNAVNKDYTNTLDISNISTDEYVMLRVKSSDGDWSRVYIRELYLY